MANGVKYNLSEVIARIQKQTSDIEPSSPKLNEALTRIALYVTAIAKLNIRRHGLIDTGRLINSIQYEFFKDGKTEGVKIGSFNVPYAAVHEFGYRGTMTIKTHQRMITKAWGRSIDPRSVTVPTHERRVYIRARPYVRPALVSSRTFIIDTLRSALGFMKGK
jgi:phage gpG-like protein